MATQWARLGPITLPESILKRYVGTYGVCQITMKDGELCYARKGQTPSRLTPMAWNLCRYERSSDFRIRFECDETGDVMRMTIVERDRVNGS